MPNWLNPTTPINAATNSLFPDPSKNAMESLDKIPGTIKPYYDPYVNAGKNAIPGFQDMMKQLMENPQEFLSKMGQSYKPSPGYEWNKGQAEQSISHANAAGGLLGTPQHEQQNAEMVSGLASKDYNEYMDRIMKSLGIGAAGTESLINTGGKMSGDLATNLAQALAGKAGLQYSGQASQNNLKGDMLSSLVKLFMSSQGGGG